MMSRNRCDRHGRRLLELGDARRQVEFVVCHQDFFRLDAEETGKAATAWPLRFM
jgi:hypothetical protein